jgi:hypothetical protein
MAPAIKGLMSSFIKGASKFLGKINLKKRENKWK